MQSLESSLLAGVDIGRQFVPVDRSHTPPNQHDVHAHHAEQGSRRKRVDFVVTWRCGDDLSWLTKLPGAPLYDASIYVYDVGAASYALNDERCDGVSHAIPSSLPADHVVVATSTGIGSEAQAQMAFLRTHYDNLADRIVFARASHHWSLTGVPSRSAGWSSQLEAIQDLLPKSFTEEWSFVPLSAYTSRGPVLWQDKEYTEEPNHPSDDASVLKFGPTWADLYNRGRELYSILFEGTPCQAPALRFPPGMQYVVARDWLRARPREVWARLEEMLANCGQLTWSLERLIPLIYNASMTLRDSAEWRAPSFCALADDAVPQYFTEPLNRLQSAEFWRRQWGCEPLSEGFLSQNIADGGAMSVLDAGHSGSRQAPVGYAESWPALLLEVPSDELAPGATSKTSEEYAANIRPSGPVLILEEELERYEKRKPLLVLEDELEKAPQSDEALIEAHGIGEYIAHSQKRRGGSEVGPAHVDASLSALDSSLFEAVR